MHFNYSSNVTCHGRWIRQICNLALADLPHVRAADGLVKKTQFHSKKRVVGLKTWNLGLP